MNPVPAKFKADTWASVFPKQAVLIGETAFIEEARSYFEAHVRELSLRTIPVDQDRDNALPPGFPLQGPWCLICDLVTSNRSLRLARNLLLSTSNVPFIAIGNQPVDLPEEDLRGILELGVAHVLPLPGSWAEAWTEIRKVLVRRLHPLLSVHSTQKWLLGVLQSLATEERNCCVRISSRKHGKTPSSNRDHGTSLRISPVGLLGEIYLREGQPLYAWSTRLQGDEAIIDLMQTSNVQISVMDSTWIPPNRNVQSPLQGVLLEFMRRKDLGQLEPPSSVLSIEEMGESESASGSPGRSGRSPGFRGAPVPLHRKGLFAVFGALVVLLTGFLILHQISPRSGPAASAALPTGETSSPRAPSAALQVPEAPPSLPPPEPAPKRVAELDSAPKAKEPAPELVLPLAEHVTLESVLIPAGKLRMGSPEDEQGRNRDEGPVRDIVLRAPFYMGRYEVTQEQYETVMGQNPSQFKGARRPVESVSSFDAQEFCEKVTARTGREVRLPTEAEWEYACRGGSLTPFHTGRQLDSMEANIDGRIAYGGAAEGPYRGRTLEVGSFSPNAYGLYDMHGNVGEWCLDYYEPRAYDRSGSAAVLSSPSRPERVWRGGAYNDPPRRCRSAAREHYNPGGKDSTRGFRVVIPLSEPPAPPDKQ